MEQSKTVLFALRAEKARGEAEIDKAPGGEPAQGECPVDARPGKRPSQGRLGPVPKRSRECAAAGAERSKAYFSILL
ncbi:MAG: hypothetical protein V3V64_07810, partial [Acidiferrobacterales bacterium]